VTAFSIVDVGVAKVFANGDVFNLKNVEDFEGMFMAAVAGATLGGGAGAAAMPAPRSSPRAAPWAAQPTTPPALSRGGYSRQRRSRRCRYA
jgi:hypothetical protein